MLLAVADALVHPINPNVKVLGTLAYSVFGKSFHRYGTKFEANTEHNKFAKEWRDLAEEIFREGKVKPARIDVNRGGSGLEGVLNGLEEMRQEKVSGVKLIYTI